MIEMTNRLWAAEIEHELSTTDRRQQLAAELRALTTQIEATKAVVLNGEMAA